MHVIASTWSFCFVSLIVEVPLGFSYGYLGTPKRLNFFFSLFSCFYQHFMFAGWKKTSARACVFIHGLAHCDVFFSTFMGLIFFSFGGTWVPIDQGWMDGWVGRVVWFGLRGGRWTCID
jgi:hypothetical protein